MNVETLPVRGGGSEKSDPLMPVSNRAYAFPKLVELEIAGIRARNLPTCFEKTPGALELAVMVGPEANASTSFRFPQLGEVP